MSVYSNYSFIFNIHILNLKCVKLYICEKIAFVYLEFNDCDIKCMLSLDYLCMYGMAYA